MAHFSMIGLLFAGKNSAKGAIDEYIRYHTPDTKEFEVTFDGPTGHGIGRKAVGCQSFFQRMGFSKDKLKQLLEYGKSLDTFMNGGAGNEDNEAGDHQSFLRQRKGSTLVTRLNELISKFNVAVERPE